MMKTGTVGLFLALALICVSASYGYGPHPPGPVKWTPCRLPPDAGNCGKVRSRWYYDTSLRSCRPFNYGCCGGNANNFKTRQLCENICNEDRVCTEWICEIEGCTNQTCPNFPKAACFTPCPCSSVWIYNGKDVTDKCYNLEAPTTPKYP
uniref:Kunitz-type serine protease inhibitor homolog beta-bungarotoxin B1 chain-like n=1 Tax=Crassostrea virginica TaxID=6565 RepID=A0A8B8C2I2_CRAVI|nr:kunitz-type serine protease inhibitor homolog beta-bungarotoxin B1 chain-like [Crassostrea virginica]